MRENGVRAMRTGRTAASGAALLGASLAVVHMANAQSPADFFMEEARRVERQMLRQSAPPKRTVAPVISQSEFTRIVCTRTCDGARMVMAIRGSDRDHDRYEQMCRAAGGANRTQLSLEKLAPIKTEQLMVSGPVMDGRAALTSTSACTEKSDTLSVPIFADTTLRRGDVVALESGLHIFIGNGRAPFNDKDFRRVEERDMAKGMHGMEVAGTITP